MVGIITPPFTLILDPYQGQCLEEWAGFGNGYVA